MPSTAEQQPQPTSVSSLRAEEVLTELLTGRAGWTRNKTTGVWKHKTTGVTVTAAAGVQPFHITNLGPAGTAHLITRSGLLLRLEAAGA